MTFTETGVIQSPSTNSNETSHAHHWR